MSEENATGAGSGKSEAEIAFALVNKLKGQGVWGEKNLGAILDMFAECLDAAKGLRAYPGQNRIEAPVVKAGAKAPMAQRPQHAPQPNPAQLQQAQAQAQLQRQTAAAQAYKQG